MPYYGDYYRGDYYRGDPGFLSGAGRFIGGLARGAQRLGIGGPVAAAVARALPAGAAAPAPGMSLSLVQGPGTLPTIRPGGSVPAVVGVSPRGTLGIDVTPESWRGYHLNKTGYFLRNGTYVPARSRMVRNRSMNVGNARALKRGLRRAFGFRRLAMGVMSFALTGKKRGPARFKTRAHRGR